MYENIISYLGLPDTKNPNHLGFGFYLQFMMRQVWGVSKLTLQFLFNLFYDDL